MESRVFFCPAERSYNCLIPIRSHRRKVHGDPELEPHGKFPCSWCDCIISRQTPSANHLPYDAKGAPADADGRPEA